MDRKSITDTIKPLMPVEVELRENQAAEGYSVVYSWLLKSDPERPNKRSKNIVINICGETLDDFSNLSDSAKTKALVRLETFIKTKLEEFEPDHGAHRDQSVPNEVWQVTSVLLLS